MSFLEYTRELNNLVISLQDEKEIIDEEDVIKAIYCINNMRISEIGDVLLFLASLNLCNTYAKYDRDRFGYVFKKGIEYILEILNYNYIEGVYINYINNNGMLYIFQVGDIQFSFHDEKSVLIDSRYITDLSWDGVRKQCCAKSIFNSVFSNNICVSNKTFRDGDLKEMVNKTLDNYRDNKVSIDELLRVKL